MRVTSVDLYSNDKRVVKFDVVGPDVGNPYLLKGIAGTDAEEIIPMYYGQGTESREKFYDMKMPARELTIRIGLNPNYALAQRPADLRDNLMRMISSRRGGLIQIRLNDGAVPIAAISGFITKFIGPVTNKEPEAQITVRCDDPLFKSLSITQFITAGLDMDEPNFVDPISTAPHGFYFHSTLLADTSSVIVYDASGDWEFNIDYDFVAGDQIYFSSDLNNKYIYRVRSSVTLHLGDVLVQGSQWPILFPGENPFIISGHFATWNEVYWYETFWGI